MEETLGSIRALTTYFASVLDETTGFCPSLNAGAAGHQRWGDPPQAAGHRHPGAVAAVLHPALAAAVQLLGPYSVGAALPGTPPDPCHAVPSLCLTSLVSAGCRGQDAGRHVRARRAATDKPLHGYPYASSAAQGCVRARVLLLLRAIQFLFVPRLMKACISSKGVGGGVLLRAHTASRVAARPDRLVLCRPRGSAAGVTLCTAVPEMDLAVSAASNFRMCQSFSVRLIFKKYWLLSSTWVHIYIHTVWGCNEATAESKVRLWLVVGSLREFHTT